MNTTTNLRIGDRVANRAGRVGVVLSTMKIGEELLYIIAWNGMKHATACKREELGLLHGRY